MKKRKQPVLLVSVIVLALVLGAYIYFFKPFTPEYRKEPVKNDELIPGYMGVACSYVKDYEIIEDRKVLKNYEKFNLGMSSQSDSSNFKNGLPPYRSLRSIYVANYKEWLAMEDQNKISMMKDFVDKFNDYKQKSFEVYFSTCIDGNSKPIGFVRNYNGEKKAYFDWN